MQDIYNIISDDAKSVINYMMRNETRCMIAGSIALKFYDVLDRDANDVDFICKFSDMEDIYRKIIKTNNQRTYNVDLNIAKIQQMVNNKFDRCIIKLYISNIRCCLIGIPDAAFVMSESVRFGPIDVYLDSLDNCLEGKRIMARSIPRDVVPRSENKHIIDLQNISAKMGTNVLKGL